MLRFQRIYTFSVELYKSVYRNIENEKFQDALQHIWSLSQINLIDQQMWDKMENVYKKWQNHLNIQDLINFSLVIQKNQKFLSSKIQTTLEYQIKKNKSKVTDHQIILLIQSIFPTANKQFQQFLVTKFITATQLTEFEQMKALSIILDNSRIERNQISKMLLHLSKNASLNDIDSIIIYLQIFYTKLISQWYQKCLIYEELQNQLSEVVYGMKRDATINQNNINLDLQSLEAIYSQINIVECDDYRRLMAYFELIKVSRMDSDLHQRLNISKNINELFKKCYQQFTPNELAQLCQEFIILMDTNNLKRLPQSQYQTMFSKETISNCLQQYIDSNKNDLNNDDIIKLLEVIINTKLSQTICEQLVQLLVITISEQENLTQINQILKDCLRLYTKSTIIQQKQNDCLSNLMKFSTISSQLKFETVRFLTLNQKLETEDLEILWKKVKIQSLQQLQEYIQTLRLDREQNSITQEVFEIIHNSFRQQFQLQGQ